ncbi:MAG TPA: SMP-30/gluconolactonase/LRE family protein [Thermoanaerobaculia bacterium]
MRIIRIALVTALLVTSTAIAHPGSGIVVDRRGYVYFLDTGIGVWVVDPSGKLARHDGPRFHWMAIDESEQPFGARLPAIPGGEVTPAGVNPTLLLSSDVPVVIGRDGALYYSEFGHDERLRIMRFTRSGVRTVRAIIPLLRWVNGLAAGPDGSLYYTEDKAVRRIDEQGVVSTLAKNIAVPNCARIPGTEAGTEPYMRGLAVSADGAVFVAASGCGAVLEITPRGEISTVLRSVPPWSPTAVAVSPSGLYVLEYLHTATEDRRAWVPRVRKLLPNGSVVGIAVIERPKIGR